ncbi:MAG: ankyrin repeat domain-containing protein [Bdellovibrionales bacterium]|nr:ankyrin repeat domain-containing protein [Bdellovibrionales bacterium]
MKRFKSFLLKESLFLIVLFGVSFSFGDDSNNKEGNTALHVASQFNDVDVIKALLESGADPTAKNKYKDTPLHLAIKYENSDVVEALLANGADINAKNNMGRTPLHNAASENSYLHFSIRRYISVEFVKFLLANGADVNARDKEGNTALSFAIKYKNKNLEDFLKAKGAKGDNKNKKGMLLIIKNKCREIF